MHSGSYDLRVKNINSWVDMVMDTAMFSSYLYVPLRTTIDIHPHGGSTYRLPGWTYSRLSLSRIPRDSLKHFEISVPRHIRVERVRKTIN